MADNDQTQNPETSGTSGSERRRRRGERSSKRPEPPDPSKLKFFTLIPDNTNFDFVGNQTRGIMLSLFLILISVGMMVYNAASTGSALNYGIDFQGGSSVRLALTAEPDVEQLRTLLDEAGYSGSSVVMVPDADNEVLVRVKEVIAITEAELDGCRASLDALDGAKLLPVERQGFVHPNEGSKIFMKFDAQPTYAEVERLMGAAGCEGSASSGMGKVEEFPVEYALIGVGADITKVIDAAMGDGSVDHIVASETVGAKVGDQLKLDGVKAMLFAIGFIFLFVMIRFDLRFAPGGIVALIHDAVIVVGAFAITGKEFNLQSIAALLTIVGYSINDTIVVFDRVRERVALHRDDPIEKTTNSALNDTLSRTVLTSATTIVVVLCTWVLGSGPIKDFSFALFVGLIVGTYSSLFVASPVFLWVNEKIYKGKGHLITAEKDAAARGTGTLLGGEAGEGEAEGEGEGDDEDAEGIDLAPSAATEGKGQGDDGAEDDDLADLGKVADVDKPVGERKTRRRRRPKG